MAEPTVTRTPVVLDIGNERQLFVDDHLIDGLENISRFVHQPVKHDRNPVFRIEKPWEGQRIVPMALVFDSEEKIYKYWYSARATAEGDPALAYALSEDGVNFTRPDLGLVEYDGSAANNLIAMHTPMRGPVLKETTETDPERRYKMVHFAGAGGVAVAFSPDGLQWTPHDDNPVLKPTGDGFSLPFWDERYGRYVLYVRPNGHHIKRWSGIADASAFPTRRVGRSESIDFVHWTSVEEIITPDDRDGPGIDFYYMHVLPYQGCYVGFLTVYHEFTDDPRPLAGFNYTLDLQLAFSRDGKEWLRVGSRQCFLRGTPGTWDARRVYGEKAFVRDNEIWIYYRGSNVPHLNIADFLGKTIDGCEMVGDFLGLAQLRLDGFASLDAGDEEGMLVTRGLRFDGGSGLVVNADASQGSLQVEALTLYGEPIEGLTRDECQPIRSDGLRHTVTWESGKQLRDVEQPVRLRFYLKQTQLYSFAVLA